MEIGIVAVDLGTTGVKAALFDERGSLVAEASREQQLCFPQAGFVEQDPSAWYEVPCAMIAEVLQKSGADAAAVRAVGFSSQGISIVPVDSQLRPLCNGISWLDMRAEAELAEILKRWPEKWIFEKTGKHADAAYTLPKLLWLQRHQPSLFDRARWFLMPMDYCISRMTGSAVTDPSMASGTMLADLRGNWIREMTDALEIPVKKLPKVMACGSCAGGLNRETAVRTGLPEGIPIVVGAQDQKAAACGARITPNWPTLSLGTAGALEFLTECSGEVLPAFPHVGGDGIMLEACINTAGAAIRWARDSLFPTGSYGHMNEAAARAELGSSGVVFRPYLSGAGTMHLRPGLTGSFEGLTLRCTRDDLVRAVYEGLACEIRWCLEEAGRTGLHAEGLKAFGGGTKSGILMDIIADICNLPVVVSGQAEMALLGAARLAAEAVEMDVSDFGLESCPRIHTPHRAREYEQVYHRYRKFD